MVDKRLNEVAYTSFQRRQKNENGIEYTRTYFVRVKLTELHQDYCFADILSDAFRGEKVEALYTNLFYTPEELYRHRKKKLREYFEEFLESEQ
jgi:hypothetical protein